jgi:hypothetical protein
VLKDSTAVVVEAVALLDKVMEVIGVPVVLEIVVPLGKTPLGARLLTDCPAAKLAGKFPPPVTVTVAEPLVVVRLPTAKCPPWQ